MGLAAVLFKLMHLWLLSWRRLGRRVASRIHASASVPSRASRPPPPAYPCLGRCGAAGRGGETVVFAVEGALLRSASAFPFFMLVAFEAGGVLRALVLLLAYPLLLLLGSRAAGVRVMTFIAFCGLSTRAAEIAARAVLPKFYLEDMNLRAFEAVASMGRRVAVTGMPGIMVEGFLREHLGVEAVLGAELHVTAGGRYFSGLVARMQCRREELTALLAGGSADVALSRFSDDWILSASKEAYVLNEEEAGEALPRSKYPKPLVFHDGRLAFLPTPRASLALFLWLPVGLLLALLRALVGILLPCSLGPSLPAAMGVTVRTAGLHNCPPRPSGVLYVCTHRTLLDPLALGIALRRPVTAVTYSLSRVSELLAPIRTVRLSRDRRTDGATMQRLLREGDLVVCPEGTTCREPYLLRFSPLFAEITDDIVPVAVDVRVSMFYGTTASGHKWLDPLFLLMNPAPEYVVRFLPKLEKAMTCGGGGRRSCDVANMVQRDLAAALGFECTTLTRRDKYMMLAGNEGIVGRGGCGAAAAAASSK